VSKPLFFFVLFNTFSKLKKKNIEIPSLQVKDNLDYKFKSIVEIMDISFSKFF